MENKKKFSDLINTEKAVLIDFYADWCAPCKQMTPVLQQLAINNKGHLKIIKIDIEKNESVTSLYKIQSIPTMILFKNGKAIWRHSGMMDLTSLNDAIKDKIQNHG